MKIGNLEVYGVIYKITNNVNGKVYIGQTTNKDGFRGRYPISKKKNPIIGVYRHHKYLLEKADKGCNKHLLNSISRYGYDAFSVCETFDIAFSKAELNIKEDFWILYYNSVDNDFGYNKRFGGTNGKLSNSSIEKVKRTQVEKGYTRKINQLSVPDFKIIKTYDSISQATNELGLSRSSIKNVLNPKYQANTAGGYAWEYCDCKNIKYEGDFYFDEKNKKIIRRSLIEKEHIEKAVKKIKNNKKKIKNNKKKMGIKKKDKNNTSSNKVKSEKITKTSIVVEMMKCGLSMDEVSDVTGINKKEIYKIAHSHKLIPITKQTDINKRAEETRKRVLEYHLNGCRNCDIQKILNLSKSIVEKAIEKYRKNIIDEDGRYIN